MNLLFNQPHYQDLHQARTARLAEQQKALEDQLAGASASGNEPLVKSLEHKLWLHKRLGGITGSTMPVILGLSRWQSPYSLWCEYTGRAEHDSEQTEAQEWGHRLEPVIADKYADLTHQELKETPLYKSGQYPFLAGSLDRVVTDENNVGTRIVEIKTTATNYDTDEVDEGGIALKAWGQGNKYDDAGNLVQIDSQVPRAYLLQVMHYMIVTGIRVADIAVLMNTNTFRVFTVEYDEDLAAAMIKRADEFWCKNVLDDVPPARVESDVKGLTPAKGNPIEATPELVKSVADLAAVQAQIKTLETQEKALRDVVCGYIGEHDRLVNGGRDLVTYGACKRTAFDSKRFAIEHPDLYNQYKTSSFYRRLVVSKSN